MCGMNLAFNRETIGPAMYFGLLGDGQPLGRYDDMWAGWCTKVALCSSRYVMHSHVKVLIKLGHARVELLGWKWLVHQRGPPQFTQKSGELMWTG